MHVSFAKTMSSVVALPPHGLHIHVNNEFRHENEEAFNFRAPPMVSNTDSGSYLLQLKQVITQNMFYNIEQGLSNILMFSIDSTETSAYIDPGNYTIETLVDAINAAFAATGENVLLEYDYDERKCKLNIGANIAFQWISPNVSKTQGTRYSQYDRLISMLGFWENRNIAYSSPAGLVLTAYNPVNLVNRRCMNICLDRNLDVTGSNYTNPQILCTIPIVVPFGEPIFYEPIQPRTFLMSAHDMDSLQITVIDEYGVMIKSPEHTTLQISWTMIPQGRSYD